MSFATLGGILLCVGAFLTMKGQIYRAVFVYLLADLCWISMAVITKDMNGIIFTTIGTILGTIALVKMYLGHMRKDIIKDGN